MKVNVSGILRDVNSRIKIDDKVYIPLISFKGDDIPVNSPMEVKAEIINSDDYLLINGEVKANLKLKCSRCLESFDYPLNVEFEEKLSNRHNQDGSEDMIYFEGDTIDITEIIINSILLSLPINYICSENCKGLCPHCGKNINKEECNCSEENLDPRLEVLRNFLKDN